MLSCFQGIDYEDGFIPGEMSSTAVRKTRIDTHVISSIDNLEEGGNIW